MICVSIGRTRHKMMLIEIQEAAKRGAQMIEIRLDFLARPPDFKRLLADKACPLVAAVRRLEDGGRWKGTEDERQMLLRQAIVAGFDWVDLEVDIADKIRRFKNVKRIVSYHNLHETPEDLDAIHGRMCNLDPDVVKIAVRAQHPSDNLRVLELIRKSPKPMVAHCMGDLGVCSRVLSAKFGSPFTYAAFNKERGIAPGILSFDEMKDIYRYDKLNAETEVFGVIGDPVAHSMSPLIHNTAFEALGMNAAYVPFRVPRTDLSDFIKDFEAIPVRGYSVTIPNKEPALALANEKDKDVRLTKAANTLVRDANGYITAYNTDGPAAVESLRQALGELETSLDIRGRTVLILGAGGVARAIARALHKEAALITISNRTGDKAKHLAEEIGCRHIDWGGRHGLMCEVLINCTSVGMHPNIDQCPMHPNVLRQGMMVFDTVYTPENTILIKEARARGCHVLTGVDMFVRQAAMQFKLFTGKEPPIELMRKTIRKALSPVAIRDDNEIA